MQIFGFLCSIFIGLSLGLIGGGGSILTLPVLVYLLGVNPILSTSYSLFVVGITSLLGSFSYMQKSQISYKIAFVFSIPSLLAVFLSHKYVMSAIPDLIFLTDTFKLSRNVVLMVFFASVMLFASVSMISDWKIKTDTKYNPKQLNYPMIVLQSALVGAVTGIVGAGGGFLIIPTLVLLTHLPMKTAVGTSLLIIAAKSLFGFLGDLGNISINWSFLLEFTMLAIVGIFVGSYLSQFISGQTLKKVFGWFMMIISIGIILKEMLIYP